MHSKGLRLTKQRKIILETLKKSPRHFTVEELFKEILKRTSNISLATVYRSLKIWTEEGLIGELKFGKYSSWFNGDPHNHYHVICRTCGKIEDIYLNVKDLEPKAQCLTNYKIISHQIEFMGVCPKCKRITSIQK